MKINGIRTTAVTAQLAAPLCHSVSMICREHSLKAFREQRIGAELERKEDAQYGVCLGNAENIAVPESLHVLTALKEHRTRTPIQVMPAFQVSITGNISSTNSGKVRYLPAQCSLTLVEADAFPAGRA